MTDDKTEYRDESHINVASDVDQSKVPSTIKKLATWIRQKMYGEDVRESIARGIEKSSEVAQSAVDTANDTASRQDESEKIVQNTSDNVNNVLSDITNNAGDSAAPEVAAARKPDGKPSYKTLGERLNLEHNSNLIDEDLVSGGYVKDYFEPEIRRVKSELKDGLFTFGQMNDTHWEQITRVAPNLYRSLNHIKNFLSFADNTDLLLLNGDNNNSDNVDLNAVKHEIETLSSVFLDELANGTADRFMQLGNHDDGSARRRFEKNSFLAQDNYLHDADFRKAFHTSDSQGEVRNVDSLYFYKDYPDKKIRFISLNTSDIAENQLDTKDSQKYARWQCHTVRQEQMNWLANVALRDVPANYHVIVTGHCPLNMDRSGGQPGNGIDKFVNLDMVADLLAAFRDGESYTGTSTDSDFPVAISVDYSTQGARALVGYFCGHTHRDAISQYNDINVVELICSGFFNYGDPRYAETITEDAFDIVQVDTTNRHVDIHGFGYAKDRGFDY